jgi:nanoRNase/pAp phosphatase (c-di-AMP/oligoRNAs hydrolase)
MAAPSYRLVTRSDFDGLVCGMLLKELSLIDDIAFVHPKDMQDGKVAISERDITTNLPYVPGCHLAFDHHASEVIRAGSSAPRNHVIDPEAPSAARVVYDYYGGRARFARVSEDLMLAVDKGDSAQFTREEILDPQGWVLLNFLMDSRTGLGRFRNFRISNYELMMQLIDHCRDLSIGEILALPDVKERVDLYMEHREPFREQILRCTRVHGTLAVIDLREEETIYAGNRFMVYALFPQCDISMHVLWGLKQQNTVFAVGKSILDRRSPVSVGELCLSYGGGGHHAAGTCQVGNDRAEAVRAELIARITGWPRA